jgi:eukaryotic-like serine/threonine-protein kinase
LEPTKITGKKEHYCTFGKIHVGLSINTIKQRISGYFQKDPMDFFRFIRTKRFLRHLLGVIVVSSILIWIIMMLLGLYTRHGKVLTVPDFAGLTFDQLKSNQEFGDYEFVIVDSVFEADKPRGTVLRQDPYPSSQVKKNRKIYLTVVSTIPEKTTMPDLKYLTLRQALSTLESVGLKKGNISYIRTFDEDAIQQQFYEGKVIASGTKLDKGSVIDLTVGMGSKGQEEEKEKPAETDSL